MALGWTTSQLEDVLVLTGIYGGVESAMDSLYLLRQVEAIIMKILGDLTNVRRDAAAEIVAAVVRDLNP